MPKKRSRRAAALRASRNASAAPLVQTLEDLVFYSIDYASPYPLATNPATKSIAKITDMSFATLMIDRSGQVVMWTILNSSLPTVGGKPVPPAKAAKCKTAGDVYKAAKETTGGA